jgi:hypothetical protein
MFRNKIPMRTSEERSIPQSEHETLRAMATVYVDQHASFCNQLANKIADSEAQHLFEKVRKTGVLLRKLGNLRHDQYKTLVSLDEVRSSWERLKTFIGLAALLYLIILMMSYFQVIPITNAEIVAFTNPQGTLLLPYILVGIVAFVLLYYHFHEVRLMHVRDQLAWRVDDATSEVELINPSLSARDNTVLQWADLFYIHSCLQGEKNHIIGFIDRQARRKNLRLDFSMDYYGFYPELTFKSCDGRDPRMPASIKHLIEYKLFISMMKSFYSEVHWDLCEEWRIRGADAPEDTIRDYYAFQRNYNA